MFNFIHARAADWRTALNNGVPVLAAAGLFTLVVRTRGEFAVCFVNCPDEASTTAVALLSPAFAAFVGILLGLTAVVALRARRGALKNAWNGGVVLASLILGVVYLVGVLSPFIGEVESLR
jgi:hypothetical protein